MSLQREEGTQYEAYDYKDEPEYFQLISKRLIRACNSVVSAP
jgi:hypothetical protein